MPLFQMERLEDGPLEFIMTVLKKWSFLYAAEDPDKYPWSREESYLIKDLGGSGVQHIEIPPVLAKALRMYLSADVRQV